VKLPYLGTTQYKRGKAEFVPVKSRSRANFQDQSLPALCKAAGVINVRNGLVATA
jgi:hypothetical protein